MQVSLNTRKVVNVSTNELALILMGVKMTEGMPTFASVVQYTDARLKKTGCPFTSCFKFSKVSVILNTVYDKAVLNQLKREAKQAIEFAKGKSTMPITFGDNNLICGTFADKFVLQYRPNDAVKSKVHYHVNGSEFVEKEKVADFLPKIYTAANQGTDKEILWRKVYLENVVQLNYNGVTYLNTDHTMLSHLPIFEG